MPGEGSHRLLAPGHWLFLSSGPESQALSLGKSGVSMMNMGGQSYDLLEGTQLLFGTSTAWCVVHTGRTSIWLSDPWGSRNHGGQ